MQIRYKTDSDAKMQRGVEAKPVTENSSDEYESIVGWAYQPNNKA